MVENSIKEERGYFGEFGGRYVPEELLPFLDELKEYYLKIRMILNLKKNLTIIIGIISGGPIPFILPGI